MIGRNKLAASCFPRGLISLNTSVSYLIEPLPVSTGAQQHAVFRAESLHLPGGSCPHHRGNEEREEGLNDFIHGMMSPRSARVSRDRTKDETQVYTNHDEVVVDVFCLQEKRDVSQNMKYVELLIVADKAAVRIQFCHVWPFLKPSREIKMTHVRGLIS